MSCCIPSVTVILPRTPFWRICGIDSTPISRAALR
jgi:hypothetical protein